MLFVCKWLLLGRTLESCWKQMSLFITYADSLSASTSSLCVIIRFGPSHFPPPFLPPSSLGGRFLPVSTSPGGGGGCLIPASSTLLSLTLVLLPFSCSLSVDSPLSHRNGLHYLPSKSKFKDDILRLYEGPSVQVSEVAGVRKRKIKRGKKNKFLCHIPIREWQQGPEGVCVKCNPSPAISITRLLKCFGHAGQSEEQLSSLQLFHISHITSPIQAFFFPPAH